MFNSARWNQTNPETKGIELNAESSIRTWMYLTRIHVVAIRVQAAQSPEDVGQRLSQQTTNDRLEHTIYLHLPVREPLFSHSTAAPRIERRLLMEISLSYTSRNPFDGRTRRSRFSMTGSGPASTNLA
jgi:hypothetical protein